MNLRLILPAILLHFLTVAAFAQNGFKVVPLGVKGGTADGNLSAYMLAPAGSDAYVCLDAGTVSNGIAQAVARKAFDANAETVLKKYIKGYLISHPHLDHISGMIINSVDDTVKQVYAMEHCMNVMKMHYFNWQTWPNLASEGNAPALKKYQYQLLTAGTETPLAGTEMTVRAFPLSHSKPYSSTAFLLRSGDVYALYFGDTGPDEVEQTTHMQQVWEAVAPMVKSGKLKGIFLEVSYPNAQPDRHLYGHLTPKWFTKELQTLGNLAGKDYLRNLNVVVTHIKPTGNNEAVIRKELADANTLGLSLIFPEQGVPFILK
ncbi:3',5'-cyclic-nucleotide phosphodiesterase [Dyadobacter beijingensis]|uniref:3',5'-cyclic-nucleotide phosphodiesterase n=1 Tax=Dyadobacter beijingensis TaxID=365489 RepID=A0ABQ2IK96_9BACT|nr:3',5'-cyclic-nucleotide phosphodiesterase [Dyadobacter beijingensis]GGN11093.1 3',5'-cyclic-nucleotide phosphodiesterase [Dyadobacter beijingensis]